LKKIKEFAELKPRMVRALINFSDDLGGRMFDIFYLYGAQDWRAKISKLFIQKIKGLASNIKEL
jgi:hypothetical protein